MKVSHNWLQTFFEKPLPSAEDLAERLTFHSAEIEEVVAVGDDTVIDVKVLPDKSAWLLSHRGVAREVSVLYGIPLGHDPLACTESLTPVTDQIAITREAVGCDQYTAALMTGVTVGPSPQWLQDRLRAIGQRPINVVVDVANYVMFEMGQPLHAFDADKLGRVGDRYAIGVRLAHAGETLTTLMDEEVTLTAEDMVIVDGTTNEAIAVAGVKGGLSTAVDERTTSLLIEAAHFDRILVRKTAQRHGLRTDASARYENGVPRALAPLGLRRVCELLSELTGGQVVGYVSDGAGGEDREPVAVTLDKINRVLGLTLTVTEVAAILDRTGYHYGVDGELFAVTPPFERDDITLPEDVVEEIGRLYGLTHITAVTPVAGVAPAEINVRHYYAERIRQALTALSFSEIFTSSFRASDVVKLKNALASDKGYLRSALQHNVAEALVRNVPHRDFLGLTAIQIFELGTVFEADAEHYHLAIAVRTGSEYKAKVDDPLLVAAKAAVEATLGCTLAWLVSEQGMAECRLSDVLPKLPVPTGYESSPAPSENRYQSFSLYPAVSRDVALWVTEGTAVSTVAEVLRGAAGTLCVRLTHIDTFTKDGRTSLAFRLVFQASDRTLTSDEVDTVMQAVYAAVGQLGWEVR